MTSVKFQRVNISPSHKAVRESRQTGIARSIRDFSWDLKFSILEDIADLARSNPNKHREVCLKSLETMFPSLLRQQAEAYLDAIIEMPELEGRLTSLYNDMRRAAAY